MPAPGCQVIGAGWCRTGTSSLQAALCALGFAPCFHSRLIPYLPELRDACFDYCTGRTRAFPTQHVFRRYRAAVDLPAALIPLLLDAFPDAKARPGSDLLAVACIQQDCALCTLSLHAPVSSTFQSSKPTRQVLPLQVVLTVREPDEWYDSVRGAILLLYFYVLVPFAWVTKLGRRYTAIIAWNLRTMFGSDLSREACVGAFEAHTAYVTARVPPARLLVWRPQDGWEPLCRCGRGQGCTGCLCGPWSVASAAADTGSNCATPGFLAWRSPRSPSRRRRTRARARCCRSCCASGCATRWPRWACASATSPTRSWTCRSCRASCGCVGILHIGWLLTSCCGT
jgi:hypothetical protein